jgi:hypothetical protein
LSQDVITCPSCERKTAAARGTCIYCGSLLPVSKIEAAPPQRNIDASELAFNTILNPTSSFTDKSIAALASALGVELEEAKSIIRSGKAIPISRCQNAQEAEMIAGLVNNIGLTATVVSDQELRLQSDLVRARKLTVGGGMISVHHSGGAMVIKTEELKVVVMGGLKKTRVDYSEGILGGRGKQRGLIDSAEYISDETILDVYSSEFERSFRIKGDAFDFSGLVSPLSFRAEANLKESIAVLAKLAPQARIDLDFGKVRNLLGRAWPERSRSESRGIQRTGFSFRPISRQSIISDNSDQFDRYSRLMFLLS